MKKVLLTGASGFVGKNLVKMLLKEGYEIHAIERYVTGRYSMDNNNKLIKQYANLSDFPAVRRIVREVQPDYCIHLGAVSAVSFSYDHYLEVSDTNYLGTVNLAEACYREVPHFSQFLLAGTSEEYGMSLQDKNKKLTEESQLIPNSPYAVSKVAGDLYLKYMHLAYKFPMTIMRPFNTYGRTDNTHFFIERTVTQMLTKDEVQLGDPETIRDWVYIDDHVDAYLKALGNQKAVGEVIQICTGKGYTTKETAETIARLTGFKGRTQWNSTPARPLDAKILIGDNSKAKKILGWEPKYKLEEGLNKLIDYWKEYYKK